jgi:hypothetical protein
MTLEPKHKNFKDQNKIKEEVFKTLSYKDPHLLLVAFE